MPDGLWQQWLPVLANLQAVACCVQHHVLCRVKFKHFELWPLFVQSLLHFIYKLEHVVQVCQYLQDLLCPPQVPHLPQAGGCRAGRETC